MDTLPNYTLYRSRRKTVRITLKANGTLAVYAPTRTPKKEIDALVMKNYERLLTLHQKRSEPLICEENGFSTLPFYGKRYPVYISNAKKLVFDTDKFFCPECEKEKLFELYRELLRSETARAVAELAEKRASQFGFKYNKITVKAIYSRFGSCSTKKNLNFSLALAAFEPDFIDFVVCHELCHTVHLNHGKDFYLLLDKVCPEHRKIKASGTIERSRLLKAIGFKNAN